MNEFDGISPIQNSAMEGKPISIRLYNFIIAALIFIGFCVMGAGCYITRDIHFLMYLSSHAFSVMGITFLGTIGGLILMSAAQSRQSVPMSLGGFILFITTFGFISSIGVMAADLPAINTAFTATAAITVIFGALGVLFPRFFAKISGVLCGALLAVVLVEIVSCLWGSTRPQPITSSWHFLPALSGGTRIAPRKYRPQSQMPYLWQATYLSTS